MIVTPVNQLANKHMNPSGGYMKQIILLAILIVLVIPIVGIIDGCTDQPNSDATFNTTPTGPELPFETMNIYVDSHTVDLNFNEDLVVATLTIYFSDLIQFPYLPTSQGVHHHLLWQKNDPCDFTNAVLDFTEPYSFEIIGYAGTGVHQPIVEVLSVADANEFSVGDEVSFQAAPFSIEAATVSGVLSIVYDCVTETFPDLGGGGGSGKGGGGEEPQG